MARAPAFIMTLPLLAAAKPMDRRAMVFHETRAKPARGFVKSGVAPTAKELTLRIALKPNNIDGLQAALYTVSGPASRGFREAHERNGQHRERVSDRERFVTPAGNLLEIVVPVGKANELLSTDFSVFTYVESAHSSTPFPLYSKAMSKMCTQQQASIDPWLVPSSPQSRRIGTLKSATYKPWASALLGRLTPCQRNIYVR
ncbi:hypothetical protein B0H14DRAFT_3616666 [Mycena olivaceomarginata]|nr:hypothetical protein B0H14DRAFT_3616666 [Mycena olivaceomarginata]